MSHVERDQYGLPKNFRRDWFDLIEDYARSEDTAAVMKAPRRAKKEKAVRTLGGGQRTDGSTSPGTSKRMRCAIEELSQSLKRICQTSMKCSTLCTEALNRHAALMPSSQQHCTAVMAAKLEEGWQLVSKMTQAEATVQQEMSTSTDYKDEYFDEYFARCDRSE
ncbi:hypothetical protein CBR_g34006 [Chara braunii]|uniref:Uncharacterized protein n=1 Tax=Chara braunii TaxID=69332 RepID=A0A388LHV1_CHABU|nr:hypothetical protein CBR_g34006 [Chara braunii]|eukprot:GBG81825.1 hypothetical protein CBR_g34006 [Chara braunii]